MTVQDLLSLPALKELKLVSGAEGIMNEITNVNIMDNPDALDWFSAGELLITSGYFVRDSKAAQNNMMYQLKSLHCPALCIKPKRYMSSIPDNIIKLSNELKIPVIELPYGISFSQVSAAVWEVLSAGTEKANRRALDIMDSFFQASIQSRGLPSVARILAGMLNNPVLFLDQFYNVLCYEDFPENPVPLKSIVDSLGDSMLLDREYIRSLPEFFDMVRSAVHRRLDSYGVDTVIIPVYVQNTHYGYIMVWHTMRELNSSDYTALRNCTMTFALECIRSNEIKRTKGRIRRDFLHALLTGGISDRENLLYLCDLHRLNPALLYFPVILSLNFSWPAQQDLLECKQREDTCTASILQHLDSVAADREYALHAFSYRGQIILLIGFTAGQRETFSQSAAKELCRELVQSAQSFSPNLKIKAGIGSVSADLMNIHVSFRQADEALRIANKERRSVDICHYQDYVVHRFLENNVEEESMRLFFQETLGVLVDQDRNAGTDFFNTLEAWIENHCNIVRTSRALFTHRNTVIYRIERISELLNSDLKDSEELLKYQLAFKIYHLLDMQQSAPKK